MKKSVNKVSFLDNPNVTPLTLDKLTVLVDMPDADIHGCFYSTLLSYTQKHDPNFKRSGGSHRYPLKVQAICPDIDGVFEKNNPSLLIQASSKQATKPQIRLEFNPTALFFPVHNQHPFAAEAQVDYLNDLFMECCGVEFFDFLGHGRISRYDVYRTICNRKPEDYIFKFNHSAKGGNFIGTKGSLDTIMLGNRSGNQLIAYNKHKHLYGQSAEGDSLRVELHMRPNGLLFKDFWKIEDPFKRVQIYSLHTSQPPVDKGYWAAFQDSCRFCGLTKALQKQPLKVQGKLKKAVSDSLVPWWHLSDDEFLDVWADMLHEVLFDRIPEKPTPLTKKVLSG